MVSIDVYYKIENEKLYYEKLKDRSFLEHIAKNGDIIRFFELGNSKGRIEIFFSKEVDEDILINFIRFCKSIMEMVFGIKINFEKDKDGE